MIRYFAFLVVLLLSGCVETPRYKDNLSQSEEFSLYFKMGVRYLEMGQLAIAKKHLLKAREIDVYSADVNNILGVLFERLKKYKDADEYYQLAITLDSKNVSIQNNYGRFLCEHNEAEKGIEILNKAIDMPLNTRKWFAYTNMGLCKIKAGDEALSESYFRQALLIHKSYPPALFEMLKISYRDEKYMSARAFLERYLSVASQNAETLWYAVQIENALGNKVMADNYSRTLFSVFPASKRALQLKKKLKDN